MSSSDVDEGAVHGVFVRHIPHDADPLYQPDYPADGRWQSGSVVAAWYFADEPATAWAEWYRSLAGAGLPPTHALPRDLWRWRIDLVHVALLDDDERLHRVGVPPPLPTISQWPMYQAVGNQLYRQGYQAILAASAARPDPSNLVVFRTTREIIGCTPQPPPATTADVPPVPRGMRT